MKICTDPKTPRLNEDKLFGRQPDLPFTHTAGKINSTQRWLQHINTYSRETYFSRPVSSTTDVSSPQQRALMGNTPNAATPLRGQRSTVRMVEEIISGVNPRLRSGRVYRAVDVQPVEPIFTHMHPSQRRWERRK